jgi:hypothetical protein
MRMLITHGLLLPALALISVHAPASPLRIDSEERRLHILVGAQRIATYVWQDENLPRPYFEGLSTPDGDPVTRNHPTDPEVDKGNDDHSDFHPGAWLAFGDLGGADFWRNKARVRHVRFSETPNVDGGTASFTVVNAYEQTDAGQRVICTETCTYTITSLPDGYLLQLDSTFHSADGPFAFGDQEEMGFGVRMATDLSVRHGGAMIRNSAGGKLEVGTWGKEAAWCAGYGRRKDRWIGANVMASPDNFRPSWFHSRDYGLLVANPFGKKAMTAPRDNTVPPDSNPVAKGSDFRLQFGLYVFSQSAGQEPDFGRMYQAYTERGK